MDQSSSAATAPAGRACLSRLICPVCGGQLRDAGASARCADGHAFDFARAGYLNLAPTARRRRVGDTAEMVLARERFLAGGHFAPLAAAVARLAAEAGPAAQTVVELGCGTAYHLAAVRNALGSEWPAGGRPACLIGLDLSIHAARRAARLAGALAVVADVQERIPLASGAADLALSVFAPRPGGEIGRVLRPGGALVLAFAAEDHLASMRARFGLLDVHPHKLARIAQGLGPGFALDDVQQVSYELRLRAAEAQLLVAMGPSARHTRVPAGAPDELRTRVSAIVARFART